MRFLLLLSLLAVSAFSRPVAMRDTLPVEIQRGFLSSVYKQEGAMLDLGSLMNEVEDVEGARGDVRAAKAWGVTGLVTGATGGFLIGYFGAQALFGEEFNAPAFGTGVGLIGVTMVLSKLSHNSLVKAVEKYNASLAAKPVGVQGGWSDERGTLALRVRF